MVATHAMLRRAEALAQRAYATCLFPKPTSPVLNRNFFEKQWSEVDQTTAVLPAVRPLQYRYSQAYTRGDMSPLGGSGKPYV